MTSIRRRAAFLASLLVVAAPASAQVVANLGGPFSHESVLNAPFSAVATTTVREVEQDGVESVHSVTARYFRNARGAVRAELDTQWGPYILLELPGPDRPAFALLDPVRRTYMPSNALAATWLFNGESGLPLPVGKNCFEYGLSVDEHATAEERLHAVHALVSPDLGLVEASQRFDESRLADTEGTRARRALEYALTEVRREEPPARLFEVPDTYRLLSPSVELPLVRWTHARFPAGRCTVSR